MSKATKFEDLAIFQMARNLTKEVFTITKQSEFKKDTRFVQQIHASAGSVLDNIAEGFERDGNKEFISFLYIAKGSCGEVRSQLIRANDVGYLEPDEYNELYNDCRKLSAAIMNFIKEIRTSEYTGAKFQSSKSSKSSNLNP